MTDLVKVTIDERTIEVPKGTGMVETAQAAGIEIPVFCYEPRPSLRSAPPHVPRRGRGMPKPGWVHASAQVDGGEDLAHVTARRGPRKLHARIHPGQPPTRLSRLRQGRRVPAPGPDVPLRARVDPHDVPEANVREADPDLAVDCPRSGALHPLLPLHPVFRRRRRGRPARRDQPRRAVDDRDVRGRAVSRPLLRQRHRAVPRRRADLDAVPLRGAPVGDPERPLGLRPLPGRLQHVRHDARGQGQAHPLAQPSRSTKAGCATRAASPSTT